ncbi:MAG: c-type cytochrome biogenesis protein CcmI, partial [Gammaproteobacteria bacterium]
RSYSVMGRNTEASDAYAKALPLLPDDAQLLADYAEALALSDSDQKLAGKPTELFEKALKLDPDNPKGLYLAGMAAFQKDDYHAASEYWKRLIQSMPADSEDVRAIKQNIAEAEARAAADADGSVTR